MKALLSQKRRPDAVWLALGVFAVTLILDQASKLYVVDGLNLREAGAINFIDPILNFRMAWNTGVNFGLGSGNPEITRLPLVLLSGIFAIGALVFSAWSVGRIQPIGLGLAAGGAIGNAIDRLHWGAVADFANMSCCGFDNPWSFNIADVAIFGGMGLAILFAPKRPVEAEAGVES